MSLSIETDALASAYFHGNSARAKKALLEIAEAYRVEPEFDCVQPFIQEYIDNGYKVGGQGGNANRGGLLSGIKNLAHKAVKKADYKLSSKEERVAIKDRELEKKIAKLNQKKADNLASAPASNAAKGVMPSKGMLLQRAKRNREISRYRKNHPVTDFNASRLDSGGSIIDVVERGAREARGEDMPEMMDPRSGLPEKRAMMTGDMSASGSVVCAREADVMLHAFINSTFDASFASAVNGNANLIELVSFMISPMMKDLAKSKNGIPYSPLAQAFESGLSPSIIMRAAEMSSMKMHLKTAGEIAISPVILMSSRMDPMKNQADVASGASYTKHSTLTFTKAMNKGEFVGHVIHMVLPTIRSWSDLEKTKSLIVDVGRLKGHSTALFPLDAGMFVLSMDPVTLKMLKMGDFPAGVWGCFSDCKNRPVAVFVRAVAEGVDRIMFVYCE